MQLSGGGKPLKLAPRCAPPPVPTCAPGQEVRVDACAPCAIFAISAGGYNASCSVCPTNKMPNLARTACVDFPSCAAGQGVVKGACVACPAGQVSPGGVLASCDACPVYQQPNAARSACVNSECRGGAPAFLRAGSAAAELET